MEFIIICRTGDCIEELTITACKSDSNICMIFASASRTLNKCSGKKANYLHIEYYCVPCIYIIYC